MKLREMNFARQWSSMPNGNPVQSQNPDIPRRPSPKYPVLHTRMPEKPDPDAPPRQFALATAKLADTAGRTGDQWNRVQSLEAITGKRIRDNLSYDGNEL